MVALSRASHCFSETSNLSLPTSPSATHFSISMDNDVITEEQRRRAEANRQAALVKRKASSLQLQQPQPDPWSLFKCRKLGAPTAQPEPLLKPHLREKFKARLEISSPDSFSITPGASKGFAFPGQEECFTRLNLALSNVMPSHYTQIHGGGKSCVYKLADYEAVLRCLKNCKEIEVEEIPWGTLNVVLRLSHSYISGKWMPCRPEHLSDEQVEELIAKLPKVLLESLLPFQLEGVRYGLRRGGRCLIADEMGLGKTLQAIAIACCFVDEGSILVVCPAILRYSWAEELERWFRCLPTDIHLVFGHKDNPASLRKRPKIVVISYTMLQRLRKNMLEQEWTLMIVDESHQLQCSKKVQEADKTKAVLDMAAKVQRIVLLSGTPSLSRPGLLGKNKFEFAKTYCAVKFIRSPEGTIFQDFSNGYRLEELNIILKQTVMIRRLKEHVLMQLPPKRRQIIRLLLEKSDIQSAIAATEARNNVLSEGESVENKKTEISDEAIGTAGCQEALIKLNYMQRGIAKLSGFCEWLSNHPIFVEHDGFVNMDVNPSSQKMIIFARHHKVLDGVQAFLCDKGICCVRIDGLTLARDRQSAVQSFRSLAEVKIAIIGVEAGGVGIDLTAAHNVVFLELPKSPSLMLQAEDRAHRRGQTKAVNIYIFCAKDTLDESHWRYLNRSLHRVSSTTDGKYGAVHEIAVEGVSDLDTSSKFEEILAWAEMNSTCAEDNLQPATSPSTSLDTSLSNVDKDNESFISKSEEQRNLDVMKMSKLQNKTMGQDNCPRGDEIDDVELDKAKENDVSGSSDIISLRFQVSQYTGRIHLFICVPGKDSRPKPLLENFRPDEIEAFDSICYNKLNFTFLKENPALVGAIVAFNKEWNSLRPIERKKLYGKTLQLPLTVELCYLYESINHRGGLLKGGSKRRSTPLNEISNPLPPNSVWKKIRLYSGGRKEKEYSQGWTSEDEPLCKLCQTPCKNINSKTPEFFEDLFCDLRCYEEFRMRTSNRFLRQELFQIEHGVCTLCQLDCHKLVKQLKPLSKSKREEYIKKFAPRVASRKKMFEKLVSDPNEGNSWHADHIIPVYRGGGECQLENMRTLCVACHHDVTAEQRTERRLVRNEARKRLKATEKDLKKAPKLEKAIENPQGQQHLDLDKNNCDDELLIIVPGSAYSRREETKVDSDDLPNSTIPQEMKD